MYGIEIVPSLIEIGVLWGILWFLVSYVRWCLRGTKQGIAAIPPFVMHSTAVFVIGFVLFSIYVGYVATRC